MERDSGYTPGLGGVYELHLIINLLFEGYLTKLLNLYNVISKYIKCCIQNKGYSLSGRGVVWEIALTL